MTDTTPANALEIRFATGLFLVLVAIHAWLVSAGWQSGMLPGNEFRQVQTAIAAHHAQLEGYRLDYPMPLLGPPWFAPMEFPLYQWSVAAVSTLTGWHIIQSGRAVSLFCFYASLPALWLLLRRTGLAPWQRRLTIGATLASPVYIFYARGFTIEPMALLFSLWFLAALVEAIARERLVWAAVAIIAGIGAGLVKITTWMLYLIPVGAWVLWATYQAFRSAEMKQQRRREIAGICAILLLPLITAAGWVWFSDTLKADHPSSAFLVSTGMTGHNFGSMAVRLSSGFWADLTHMWTLGAASPLLFVCLVVAAVWAGRWRRWAFGALGLFASAPLIFPILYSWHDYYFYANTVLLAAGAGFVFAGWRERFRSPVPAWIVLTGCLAFQFSAYFEHLYPSQRVISSGGSGLSDAIHDLTEPDDVIVTAGLDWNGAVPFYSQRRALMIRRNDERRSDLIAQLFASLRDDFVSVLILDGEQRENKELLAAAVHTLGIDPTPIATHRNSVVYANRVVRSNYLSRIKTGSYSELVATTLPEPAGPIEGMIRGRRSEMLSNMTPQPYRFRVPFAFSSGLVDGERHFNAHATTSLWFHVPQGHRHLVTEFGMLEGSYTGSHEPTDGVALDVIEQTVGGMEKLLHRRTLNPAVNAADRGTQRVDLEFDVAAGSDIVLRMGAGKVENAAFDWAYWKSIRID